jgi:Zn finger protein HypA/HybF involved in hydrogenase expression
MNSNKGRRFVSNRRVETDAMMIEHSPYGRGKIKKRLIEERLVENKCAICGMEPEWNGKPLVLILDHIDGVGDNCLIENLRLLCPNCNSQTETFAGRNRKNITIKHLCLRCGMKIGSNTKHELCNKCFNKKFKTKVERPGLETLKEKIKELGYCGTGRLYGVSDNAIRKWERAG